MASLDAIIKTYKQGLKETDATLKELESRASELVNKLDNRHDAELAYDEASAELQSVAANKETVQKDLDEAVRFDDPRKEGLRDAYMELTDREQALRDAMGDAVKKIDENTPDPGEVAELTTHLKQFRTPGTSDVVKTIEAHHREHSQAAQERVQATLSQLPTPDPRSTHEALKAADEGYRTGEGATLDQYLHSEDEASRGEQATAMLAARLEARDRRAVIAARK